MLRFFVYLCTRNGSNRALQLPARFAKDFCSRPKRWCHSSVGRAKDWKSLCRRFDSSWYHFKDSRLHCCKRLSCFRRVYNSGTNTGNLSFSNALFSHRFFRKAYLSFPPRSSSLRSLLRRRWHSFHAIKTPRLNTMSITTLFKSYAPNVWEIKFDCMGI